MEIILFRIIVLIFSVVIHEVSHGFVANYLGDPTAKNAGRLTLNPIPHLDPIGSIVLPLMLVILNSGFIIGWAKPVPVNPMNLRNYKYGDLFVSIAGPLSNFAIALIFGLALRFIPIGTFNEILPLLFVNIVIINLFLGVLNLLPIPPLDGSHILSTFLPRQVQYMQRIFAPPWGLLLLFPILFFLIGILQWVVGFLFVIIVGGVALF